VASGPPSRAGMARELVQLQQMLSGVPAAVAYLAGPDLITEFANDEFRQLVGDRDVVGVPVRVALPELAGQGWFELLGQVMETGLPRRGHETELWIRRRGDRPEQVFMDLAYQAVPGPDGAAAGLLVFAADVTAHVRDRRGQETLAEQLTVTEDRYRTLFETLPQGVVYCAADGLVIGANPAASQILGMDADEMVRWPLAAAWQAVREDGSPWPPEELPVTVALRTGEVVTDAVLGMPHGRTGETRWLRVTAVPDARDEDGRPQRAYAMIRDLTEQRRAEAAVRDGSELMGRLRDANVLGVVVVGEQRVLEANDAYLEIIGYTREDLTAGRIAWRKITPPEWAGAEQEAVAQLRRTGVCRPFEKEYLHRDGHRVPVLIGAAVIDRHPLRWTSFVVDLTARQRAERERAELLTRERAARAEAGRASERLTFLLRAGDLVAAARDRHELLRHAARLVVDSMADFCLVYLPAGDNSLRAASIAYRDRIRGGVVLADLRDYAMPTVGQLTVQAVYTTGTSQLVRDVMARLPGRADLPPLLASLLSQLRPDNVLVAPLTAGPGPVGVLALGRGPERPSFTDTDVAVVEELGRRMAIGLANADTAARDHTVAETLQRSVLPDALPRVAGLDLAVRYLPATEGLDVGGDWYDAFPLDGARVGLVIGDVVGHNIAAASVMGQIRNLLRGYAIENPQPADVLRRTNAALARLLPEALATVVYAVLDPGARELRYANAGHPPPIFTTGAGHAEYLAAAGGAMLGAPCDVAFTTARRRLPPGAGILFYTDGLIEDRHRDITDGLDALALAIRNSAALSAEQTCVTAQAMLPGGAPRADDICLLAARLTG
jgi:PAS domain S-box-containing protein